MTKKERFEAFINYFSVHQPVAETELNYSTPFELSMAVLLSAQCTDKRVNMITPRLFDTFPTPETLADAHFDEVFALIKSCSYPNNKVKHLIAMAKTLVKEFDSIMPESLEDLQKLPGVGRKTASVIRAVAFNKPAFPVDTHVFRVAERIGLSTNAKTPLDTEKQVTRHIPKEKWGIAHHWLILHGRYVCIARKPKCGDCNIKVICKFYEKINQKT